MLQSIVPCCYSLFCYLLRNFQLPMSGNSQVFFLSKLQFILSLVRIVSYHTYFKRIYCHHNSCYAPSVDPLERYSFQIVKKLRHILKLNMQAGCWNQYLIMDFLFQGALVANYPWDGTPDMTQVIRNPLICIFVPCYTLLMLMGFNMDALYYKSSIF